MNTSLYGGLIEISPDGQPIAPDLVLAYRGGTKQGIIHNVQSLTNKNDLAQAAEITFDVYKKVDNVTCELWNDIRDFRLIYIPHLDTASFNPWYELSVETDEDDATIKHCQGVHLQEAELGQLSLNDIEINTEDDIARDDYTPTIIYDPTNPEGSALDRILKDKASHYTIVHVDSSIANLQRTFSWDGSTIKGAFDDIADEVECLFVYGESVNNDGKIHRTISVYDLNDVCMECGERGTFTNKMCTKCNSANIKFGYGSDSGIFLSHENFAGNISYSSNKDEVKNCFRLVAGDDLMTATIRNINPSGSQYIWYFSDSVRADMSKTLRDKLSTYEKEYASYSSDKKIDIPSTVISDYNTLINKYKLYDSSLMNVKYPIVGYSSLTDLYYSALNFYSLLKTTLAPVSERGTKTTAAQEIKKLTTNTLSPLGIQNANKASVSTVTLALQNYAKVFVDTSLYRITATNDSYSGNVWKGTITLSSYADENDKATTSIITIYVSDATSDFIKCQLEKAMKKNDVDATGTVALFKKDEAEFKKALSFYSVDNLNILASIVRGCLDILIQQGIADPENDMYESMYYPYYSKSIWIEDELRERESEILKLRGSKSNPEGVLDYIEKQRQVIANNLDLHTYLGNSLWTEFCSFRRDDTYKNDNFISDGLSDKELIMQAKEFIKNAEREIVKSATLQHTISCNLSNFLLVKEQDVESSPVPIVTLAGVNIVSHDQLYFVKGDATFSPLLVNFDVGNWVRIEIDETIYKLRLTSYKIDYDNLDSLNVEFSDVTYGLNSASDIQSILSQAQSMSTSYSMVQHQANKGNNANKQIMDMVENGLNLTNKKIVNAADNQNMVVDETGLLMREKNEFGDDYSSEQTKIINHGFYYTNDGWKTVQTGLGKYIYFDPESGTYKEDYGIIAHKIVGNIILGNKVGIYNTSGSVKIDENGFTVTSDANDTNKDLFTLQRKNEDGSYTKYVYVDDDGNIKINGKHIQMTTSDDLGSYIDKTIKQEASALVVQLDNEYIGITTDSNGNGGNFTDCYTNVIVFSGSTDITKSSDLSWTITATSGVTGEWDKTKYRYTLKGLSTDRGEVVFDLIYMGKIAISKKLRIAKLKAGATGGQGIQGIPGKDGKDGISTYIHIKYSSVANPTDDMLTEVPAAYIGICVDTNLNDPITASSYTWSRFSGKDGADGTPGLDGKDGEDSFVHFAYAQSADGSVNFNVCEYEGATYIGVYTDNIKADSTDYKKYAWSKFKGDDGKDGDSIYITSTEVVYIPSDNGITPPQANSLATSDGKNIVDSNGNEIATNKWLSSIPYVIEGSYLWTRTTVNYSDGNSTVTYSVSRQGIDGTDGKDGINGRDGRDGSSNYVHIKYSAYPNPTDDQISEIPSDYIGICVNDVIKDPDSASSYVWSKFAGKDGEDGIPGKNGYVHFAYAMSADGKEGFSKSEFTGAIYIGVYSDNTQADSGNYKDYTWSKIKGDDGKTPVKGVDYFDGTSSYLWIRYSANSDGSGMTTTPSADTKYIGTATTTTNTAPTTISNYKWSKYVGENGTPGKNGYVHIAYADSADGKTGFSKTVGTGKKYIGQYTDNTEADSDDSTKYTWTLIKGTDGKTPIKGVDYFDGTSSYLWVRYATDANGTGMTATPSSTTKYVGIASTTTSTAPTKSSEYKWSKYVGENGVPGENGYIHIAYADSSDGKTGFDTVNGTNKKYIGQYTDNIETDSKNPTDYTWSKIKGDDGKTPVKGVDYFDGTSSYLWIRYSANSDGSGMTTTPSADTKYIGTATTTTNTAPTTISNYKWSKYVGENGTPGKNGYVHIAYADSADGKTGFSKTVGTGKKYIGQYTDNTEADSDDSTKYTWTLIKGTDGKTPIKGVDYFDGTSSYLWVRYATDANGTGMTATPSSTTKYVGIASTTTSTAPTKSSEYKWSKYVGENGVPGENGYIHIAYADSSDGKTGFDTVNGTNKKYIGQYTDNIETDSKNPTDYTWSKIKGDDVTITSTKVEYITTTENSSVPPESVELVTNDGKSLIDNSSNLFVTNKWSDEIPDLVDGMYLWTRTTVQYSDGNFTVSYTNAKQGDVGDAGRTYFLELDTSAVKIDGNNIITPDTIKAKGYYRDGDGDRVVYPCRFIISKTYSDNRTEEIISSSNNISEQIFTIYGEANMPAFYTIEMHKANQIPTEDNLLDIQTVPILVDSSNMLIGARNLLKKSNQLEGCHYYGTDKVYSISEAEIDAKRVIKVQPGTGSNAAKAVYYEVYTDNLVATELGTKLTVSMNVYSRQNMTLNVCLANTNGVMQTTDMQQIQLTSGWNKVYTVLTLEDTEFDIVSDNRDMFVTSSGQLISTGNVGVTSNVLRITDNMNSNDYYAIDYIQLEKGNRPTDYYPAPEDLTDYADKITGDMSDELKKIISDVINDVVSNRKDFDDLVGEDGRIEEIRKSNVTTQQQVDKVQTDVNTYIVRVDAINGRVESIEQTTECFSMEDAGLRITRKISSQDPSMQLSMLLSEQKLSFYQGTDEVAYFSNNKLYVTDAEILDRLQLGKFAFIPRSNGNLSFRYLGGQ